MRPLSRKTIAPARVLEIPICGCPAWGEAVTNQGGSGFIIMRSMALPSGDQELVQIMDAALADASRRAGEWLVCRLGCTQCCHGAFVINQLDALRLREGVGVLRRVNPSLAAELERRAAKWVAEFGADFPGDLETGMLGESDEERERFEDYANDAACPALDPVTGRCDVYVWRPMTCRVFGPPVQSESLDGERGLGHCELCFATASTEQISACAMPVPHELEQNLLDALPMKGETIVALALLRCDG